MDTFKTFLEDLASGRPAKKPVSSNLLKQRARENKKALDTGFMKMPDYVKKKFNESFRHYNVVHKPTGKKYKVTAITQNDAKKKASAEHGGATASRYSGTNHDDFHIESFEPHMMYKGKKKVMAKKKEDHDRLNKQGYDHDNPETKKVEENRAAFSGAADRNRMLKKLQKVSKIASEIGDPKKRAAAKAELPKVQKRLDYGMSEEKKNCGCGQDPCITYGKKEKMKESSRDKYNPKVSKMRTKEKMNKVGLPVDSPLVTEASKPTNPALWSRAKAAARSKFDVYPSAYANGWAVQWYKKRGGGWRKGKATKESVELQELSPKTISSYQKKAGKQYSDLKKSTMSAASREGGYHKGYLSQKEYDAQHDMADKKARRGKGLAMSKGKGMRQEQMQLVTNLDLDESIANLVRRGVGKVKDSLQQAGQQYKDHQAKQMKAGKGIYQNPVSGDNIRKRMKQMQSQKKD